MKLSLAKIVELQRGIGIIDAGYDATVDGKNVRRPFQFGATVHFPLQQNALAIAPHYEAWSKANQKLFRQFAVPFTSEKGEPSQKVPAEKLAEYQAQSLALLEQVVTVKLFQVKVSDLKRGTDEGKNPIPLQAIVDLKPILNDDQAKDQLVEVKDEEPPAPSADAQPQDEKAKA